LLAHDCHGTIDLYCWDGGKTWVVEGEPEGAANADHMPDNTPIRPLGARMVCSRCGYRGADVRPDWGPHVNKRHV
jgi:hypothetical protein